MGHLAITTIISSIGIGIFVDINSILQITNTAKGPTDDSQNICLTFCMKDIQFVLPLFGVNINNNKNNNHSKCQQSANCFRSIWGQAVYSLKKSEIRIANIVEQSLIV